MYYKSYIHITKKSDMAIIDLSLYIPDYSMNAKLYFALPDSCQHSQRAMLDHREVSLMKNAHRYVLSL